MNIKQEEFDHKGQFVAYIDEEQVGLMTYSMAGHDKMIIDHTEASPDHSGKGIGKNLVLAAVDVARKKGIKIIPLCPFAKKTFEKMLEIQDVLAS